MRRFFVLLALGGAATAQQELQSRIDAAQKQLESGAAEPAARALRAARIEIAALDAASLRRWAPAIEALLAKADPDDAGAQKQLEAAARKLLEIAQAYTRRKWHRAALPWCERAAQLHAKAAAPALAAAQAQVRDRAAGSSGDGIGAWFRDGVSIAGAGQWVLDDDVASSPKLGTESEGWRSLQATGPNYRVDVEVVAGDQPAKMALAVGVRPAADGSTYLLAELMHEDGYSVLRVFHVVDVNVTLIAEHLVQLTRAERENYLPLWLRVQGKRVTVGVADLEEVEVQAPVADLSGGLGLYVSGDSPRKEPVRWRGLRVRPL